MLGKAEDGGLLLVLKALDSWLWYGVLGSVLRLGSVGVGLMESSRMDRDWGNGL